MTKKTPLYEQHIFAGAQLVDFAGWEMPIHYGSQIEEHHHVRQHAGIFDVSHMGVLDVEGSQAKAFLRYALANDVEKLSEPGRALYTCMLNENGGVQDDLIVYRMSEDNYRIVLNAGRREADIEWLSQLAKKFDVKLAPKTELCILAIQGPESIEKIIQIFKDSTLREMKPFHSKIIGDIHIARTGYTGEDGVEIILSAEKALELWQQCIAMGVKPCGLGARDTLRLEAGLNLYGADMTETTSPLISNLAWTIDWNDQTRDFVGRDAVLREKEKGAVFYMAGLVMEERGVLRGHQKVKCDGAGEGEITSGSFSPTLGYSIALARLPVACKNTATVDRRGQAITVKIVKPPFVRLGQKVFKEIK